ncbi:Membrane-associated protein gex-3 [Aphelenchoides besseyi]|nr:Membrane-associated protein gex-3 [Aphelenchoides besseyi]
MKTLTSGSTMGTMSKMDSAHQKMAEKLVILNDRSLGMLTRIYNIKKSCANMRNWDETKQKPRFWPLREKSLESAISLIVKKFPVTPELKRNSSMYANVDQLKNEIRQSFSLYYNTFAELLDLKDHVFNLLNTINSSQSHLDITLNYDLTAGFLNLMSNFVALMLLIGRVEDRKAILGLFNVTHQIFCGQNEQSYPRLGQMIVDYENPLKKLSDDFASISGLVQLSLTSLYNIYFRRNISADQLRDAGMMSLISNPQQMLFAAQTDTVACEYLSLETMDRWIVFGVTVCHSALLSEPMLEQMFYKSLEHSLSLRLFRDEPLLTHPLLITFFDGIKGYSKRVQELKQRHQDTLQTCASFHAHRRQFVRTALKEMCLLIRDQPGLLGPKVLFVWMGLSLARDEVVWLLRHADLVNVNKKLRAALESVVNDRCLAELLFYMVELRMLVQEHSQVISNYYRDFICSYDAIALREMIEEDQTLLNGLAPNELKLIHGFVDAVAQLKTNDVNLCGVRIDWYRFQANVSVIRSPFQLKEHRKFAVMLNTTVFHTKMVDLLGEMLRETSDLSIYCYYPDQFDGHVEAALKFPPQARFSIAFAHITEHFARSIHDMCPEEKDHIIERGVLSCNAVLEKISMYSSKAFEDFIREEHVLTDATTPRACAEMIYVNYQDQAQTNSKNAPPRPEPKPLPGHESLRIHTKIADLSDLERRNLYFVELLQAIAHSNQIVVSEHTFTPKTYLYPRLEFSIMKNLVLFAQPNENSTPRRPSEVFAYLQSQIATLQRVDDCVGIDLARLFNDTLLQQSQQLDSGGHFTLTSVYSKFYCDLLHRASLGQIMYADHLRAFIANPDASTAANPLDYAPDQYTDTRELRCLSQLISPYGVKLLSERLISMIAGQIIELFKLVRQNPQWSLLREARKSYDKPFRMREIIHALADPNLVPVERNGGTSTMSVNSSGSGGKKGDKSNPSPQSGSGNGSSSIESAIQRITIIGGITAFRDLLYDAEHDVLKQRMPFLMHSLLDLNDCCREDERVVLSETLAAAGKRTNVDQGLVNILRMKWGLPMEKPPLTHEIEEHYDLCCLVMVFIAISLPQLCMNRQSFFKASYVGCANNCHTIGLAVSLIAGALFHIHGREDVADRMREFLALSSSGLIELVNMADTDIVSQHQSLYIVLEQIVKQSPWLNYNLLESCLPYPLVRSAYLNAYRTEAQNEFGASGAGSAR